MTGDESIDGGEGGGPPEPLPIIAIVGRPNAGKSTLFNRLTRSQRALVDAEPGVTRDRNFAEGEHDGRRFVVVDTGGLDLRSDSDIALGIRAQSEAAIEEADAVIFLLDGREGTSPADREVLDLVRRSRKPFRVAVNKLDLPQHDAAAADFFRLGIDGALPISAAHGRGIGELLDEILAAVERPRGALTPRGGGALAVAIVGRPNVGKSSLLNRIVGFDRSIVAPIAGTTRDPVDTSFSVDGHDYVLVDTAGIRRRPKVEKHLERGSVLRALRALERAQVALVVVDAAQGMADQDARLAGYAWEKGRAMVLVLNKCDRLEKRRFEVHLEGELRRQYPFLDAVPMIFTSALDGRGVQTILPMVDFVAANHRRTLPTSQLNQLLQNATDTTAPPSVKGRRPNFKYAVQTAVCPPSLVLFCSHPDLVPSSYTRFLVNRLRAAFELRGTPVRITYRAGRFHGAPPTSSTPGARRGSGTRSKKGRKVSSRPKGGRGRKS